MISAAITIKRDLLIAELPKLTPEEEVAARLYLQERMDKMWEELFPTPAPTTLELSKPRPRCCWGIVCLCSAA